MILAGGAGGRLELLTDSRAKPAVPFGGHYRLIDFPLSNCLHSGLSDVWVIQQFNPVSLTDHLTNGRPWDLDRTEGGLLVLHPRLGEGPEGWHQGTADALWHNAALIEEYDPDALVVLSADAVYKLDYAAVVDRHREDGAEVTMVTTRVAPDEAGRYGVVQADGSGRVTGYAYKPDEPEGDLVSNEVFVFDPGRLLELLSDEARQAGEDGLDDLGDAVLPRLVDGGGAREYRFDGYWRDVGTVDSYWSAHMDLLADPSPIALDDPSWPIHTAAGDRGPARLFAASSIGDVLVSPGATIAGVVEHSVIGPGVTVEEGATVRDSVVLHDTVIGAGARVDRAVLDAEVRVEAGVEIGGPSTDSDKDGITLVGQGATVPAGHRLAPGSRFPDSSDS
ncbi:MAG TPA: glucose-1-phosphate adenylyltransferase family protein [Cryptosporangiaceae bacterium]|nr:glucose-1-phosphate adenylyltransferase family protein [Cryptosporangiaceae bacterium]